MINNISEGMLRSTTKVDPGNMVHHREVSQQKLAQVKENRPVENSESGTKTESRDARDKESSRFMQVENTMVFEKYDKNGDVILRIPPLTKPVNKMA
jgi:hypothetical protein